MSAEDAANVDALKTHVARDVLQQALEPGGVRHVVDRDKGETLTLDTRYGTVEIRAPRLWLSARLSYDGSTADPTRRPNERALDRQHELIRRLEAVVEQYGLIGDAGRAPCQRVKAVLTLERQRRDHLRRRVQRERDRPGG